MRLIDQIFDDMTIDEMVVKVILPEGSDKLKFDIPYDVKQLPASLHYTYLDTDGSPVISVTKKNLVENSYYLQYCDRRRNRDQHMCSYLFMKLYQIRF